MIKITYLAAGLKKKKYNKKKKYKIEEKLIKIDIPKFNGL